jgi:NADH:ubiquinone oxidoreductase subunit 2 (subunit N)
LHVLSLTLFSKDLFFIGFLFEISTVCFIYLFFSQGFKGKEALVKFFLYSALNECLFFFGIGLCYLSFGTLNLDILLAINFLQLDFGFFLGLVFIFITFLFKIGIFPFHF